MNKIAIITGANTGLGLETTKAFAKRNIEVVMACRNESKAEKAKAEILKEIPKAQLKILPLDLSSLDAVRSFAEKFKSEYNSLDILVNNAGRSIRRQVRRCAADVPAQSLSVPVPDRESPYCRIRTRPEVAGFAVHANLSAPDWPAPEPTSASDSVSIRLQTGPDDEAHHHIRNKDQHYSPGQSLQS